MDLSKEIPGYFTHKRNNIIQVVFTSIFAYFFINIYHPFSSLQWFDINEYKYSVFSGLLVLTGMIVVVISRILLIYQAKRNYISVFSYGVYIASEIVFMSLFFGSYEKFLLKDERYFLDILLTAGQNTALILLIPYLISALFFTWQDYKAKLEQVLADQNKQVEKRFISFVDKNNTLQLTLNEEDVTHIEANENYVTIHYLEADVAKKYMLRNSMKQVESILADTNIERIHRGYFANLGRVIRYQKQKKNMVLVIDNKEPLELIVSKTYADLITTKLDKGLAS